LEKSPEQLSSQVSDLPGGEHLRMCYSCGTCVSRCMVRERVEPSYNPRRLIKKAVLDMRDEVFADKTPWLCSACDLCYPSCPQKIHISEILFAIRKLALDAGHTSPLRAPTVDGQTCVACGLCASVCPYKAIALKQVKLFGRETVIAVVDANLCMGCGLCGAQCRSASIGPAEAFSNEHLMDDLWQWLQA